MSYKKWTSKLVVALLCYIATPAWAAQAPITLEANYLQYNEETGELSASGNVKLNQDMTQIYTQELAGNIQTGEMLANGQVIWTEEANTLTGEELNYNYKTKTGQMGASKGNMDGILVDAQTIALMPEKSIVTHASVTKCPAKIPDYKMTADKVEVYPGDKLVAYNASFWIKNTKLFTIPKYTKSLIENDNASAMPRVGYDSKDGLFIKQYFEYPLKDKLAVMTELAYYDRRGFEPQFGVINRSEHTKVSLITGAQSNEDDEWVDRRPELVYTHEAFPIGKLPLNMKYSLYTGRMVEEDTNTDLWRSGGSLYINHNPIQLSDNTTLHLGGGYEYTWYENYDKRTIWRGNIGIKTAVNDRINVGVGFNHAQTNGSSPFIFDDEDIKNELTSDFSWQLDHLWQVKVSTSYDLDKSELTDIDYTLNRNLHCFEAAVTYREKRDEWKFKVGLINW